MKKILLAGVSLAVLVAASPVSAADVPVRQPYYKAPVVRVFDWTGFYFGGHVGYGWSDTDSGLEPTGFVGGLQAGYNWQFSPNWVFGLEADITGTDMNDSIAGVHSHIDYLGTVRARLGYAVDRTLFYGTGGVAFNRNAVAGVHDSDTGYTLGLGIEWAFGPNWSAKVEYAYYNFDNNVTLGGTDISTVKFGLNYRFGR